MTAPSPERIDTPISRMLGIRYPLVVAPMFLVSNAPLLEAAARAGAIGAVPTLNFRTAAAYREFLDAFPRGVPFGVNLALKLSDRLEDDVRLTVERKVPLVITSLGDPTLIVQAVHAYGGIVWCDVIGLRHAEKAVKAGADAIVAVGTGAGGHAGRVNASVLGPWLKKELGVPVVMAGGLTRGRDLLAALALGCDGGYFGTRFIATLESAAPPDYKQALVQARPEDIEYTPEVSGVHGNFLKPSLERYRTEGGKAWKNVWSAGHGVAFVDRVSGTEALIREMIQEYGEALAALPK